MPLFISKSADIRDSPFNGHFGHYFAYFMEPLNGICAYLADNFINLSLWKERGFVITCDYLLKKSLSAQFPSLYKYYVLKNIGDQKAVDAIVVGAVARWKFGWGKKKVQNESQS